MALDVRLDPFLKAKFADPDAVVKSAPVEKAWSDEAREAAAEARRRGSSGKDPGAPYGYNPSGGAKQYDNEPESLEADPEFNEAGQLVGWRDKKPSSPVGKTYPLGPGPAAPIPASVPTQTARQGMKDTLRVKSEETFSPVGKAKSQRPPGPRVIEVAGDQGSIARDYDLLTPGQVTDKKEEGDCLFSPVEKVWSDEARAAAAEARRRGSSGGGGSTRGRAPMRTGSQMESDAQRAGNRADDRDWARTQRENPRARPGYRPSDRAPKTPHTHAVMVDGGFDKTFPDAESAKAYAERLRSRSRSGIPSNRPTRATVTRIPRDLREKSAGPRVAGE